jgi:hypothetical protein
MSGDSSVMHEAGMIWLQGLVWYIDHSNGSSHPSRRRLAQMLSDASWCHREMSPHSDGCSSQHMGYDKTPGFQGV